MITLSDLHDMFIARCESMNLSKRTIEDHYENTFNRLEEFLRERGKPQKLDTLSTTTLRAFLAWRAKRVSACSARHDFQTLRCLFNFLLTEEIISTNPMAKIIAPRQETKPRQVYSTDEIQRLLKTCAGNTFVDLRDRAIIALLADTGLRAGELCGLAIDDVDLKRRCLTVRHAKGGKSRLVPFGQALTQPLRKYLLRRGDIDGETAFFVGIYGEQFRPRGLLSVIKRRGVAAGLDAKHCQLHAFRRYSAVESLRAGMSPFVLQRKLGHSSLTMVKHYCQLSDTDLAREQDIVSPGNRLLNTNKRTGRHIMR
ncbi:MAG TPA: tyrosine-type recombinase/integrase [Armatimonadota bacterium]|nr:tyrosine-type recombinase/integrase [Armatimonadota bacterium]